MGTGGHWTRTDRSARRPGGVGDVSDPLSDAAEIGPWALARGRGAVDTTNGDAVS